MTCHCVDIIARMKSKIPICCHAWSVRLMDGFFVSPTKMSSVMQNYKAMPKKTDATLFGMSFSRHIFILCELPFYIIVVNFALLHRKRCSAVSSAITQPGQTSTTALHLVMLWPTGRCPYISFVTLTCFAAVNVLRKFPMTLQSICFLIYGDNFRRLSLYASTLPCAWARLMA